MGAGGASLPGWSGAPDLLLRRAVWALGLVVQQAFTEHPLCAELCTPGAPPQTRGLALPPLERRAGPPEAERAQGGLPQHAEGTLEADGLSTARAGHRRSLDRCVDAPGTKIGTDAAGPPPWSPPFARPRLRTRPPHRPHTVPKAGPRAAAQAS